MLISKSVYLGFYIIYYWSPAKRKWDLCICFCLSVSVRLFELDLRICSWDFFNFFAEICGIIRVRKWRFRILAKKSRFRRFRHFWSKFGHFGPKMAFWAHFSKTGHEICLIFPIETSTMLYYYNYLLYMLSKICFGQFWPFFVIFWPLWGSRGNQTVFYQKFLDFRFCVTIIPLSLRKKT